MIFDNTSNISTEEIVASISAHLPKHEYVVVQYDHGKKVLKTKVPIDRAEWVIGQVPPSKHLSVSCSTYLGKDILPNFGRSNVVSVALDTRGKPAIRTPRDLFNRICECLSARNIPHPSALVCTPLRSEVLWILDRSVDHSELSDLYATELGLCTALKDIGSSFPLGTASRYIALPRLSDLARPVSFIANGAISQVSAKRLLSAAGVYVSHTVASKLTRNVRIIEELGALLQHRLFSIPFTPEDHWLWIGAYAAASGSFVGGRELKEICRSIAESLENRPWESLTSEQMTYPPYSYRSYVEVIQRNAAASQVRLGRNDYYALNGDDWPIVVSRGLHVTDEEVAQLGLEYLRPSEEPNKRRFASCIGPKASVGIEEYVPLSTFLMAA